MSAKKNVIVMTRYGASALAELAVSVAPKDDVTPILCAAHVEVIGDRVRVHATDRYRAHAGTFTLLEKARPHTFVIPIAGLEWLKRNYAFHGRHDADAHRVTITTVTEGDVDGRSVGGKVTITVAASEATGAAAVSWSGLLVQGKFPPVWDLIAKARDAEPVAEAPRLNLDMLAKSRALATHRGEPARTKVTAGREGRPPVLYAAWGESGSTVPRAEAILQANAEQDS